MSEDSMKRLDSLLTNINRQLAELAELTSEIAKWPKGPGKQAALDKLFSNQDKLFSLSEQIRNEIDSLRD